MTVDIGRRLAPGDTVGILGAGQLGRMLAMAAARLGLRVHSYSPDDDSPAFAVSAAQTVAAYEDEAALQRFARDVDVITYEFENVPARTAAVLAEIAPVRPGARALAVSQDRLAEKRFMRDLGIATAPFWGIDNAADLRAALDALGRPAILKTRRFGYDGKGQASIREATSGAEALHAIGADPDGGDADAILEGFVAFEQEVSIVCSRGLDGSFVAFPPCWNHHSDHILHRTVVPAPIAAGVAKIARSMAQRIAQALDYVGVLSVELFVVNVANEEPRLLVNEIAPRVHNSGHWTEVGARTSQFEQHIRAICGWPLGATDLLGRRIEMRNLIGDEVGEWHSLLTRPGCHLHLYGKTETRPGRKMGHWTQIDGPPCDDWS